ncbi:MAG: PilZ domain-containing protein [Candidatus Rokuibacteriota bacterium]|nr:MAG: PilZ domain-containing protein [Candidatus Rokubacteria bacterium]
MLRCPRCGQEAARRSPRAGVWEHVVSVLYLYPFRCQLCSTRFRSFQRRRYTRRSQDRREYDRLAVRVPVTIVSGAERAEGETADLSLTGCSVRTAATFAAGSTVQLRLRLGQSGDVSVESAVVRTQRDGGLGLQFEKITATDHDRLSRYLGRFLRPSGTSRRRSAFPRPEVVLAAAIGVIVILMMLMLIGHVGGPPLR